MDQFAPIQQALGYPAWYDQECPHCNSGRLKGDCAASLRAEITRLLTGLERVCAVDKFSPGRRDCDIWAEMLAEAAHTLRRSQIGPIAQSEDVRELIHAFTQDGARYFRIKALEAALDWALPAVFTHYTEGEAPKVLGAFEELEKGRDRVFAELDRLSESASETSSGQNESS